MRRLGMLKDRVQDARFLAFMAVFTGLVFLLYREDLVGPSLIPLTLWTARVTVLLLHWLGIEAGLAATVISHPEGFAYEIAYSCVGVLPVAFFSTAVLAYPAALVHRFVGVTIGLPVLLALNFSRLLHLFYLGVLDRADFELWHEDLWRTIILLSVIGLWLSWACWAERRSTGLASQANPPFPWRERDKSRAL
jgi:exosortase H (IPTLxxWG-CTERM-specific)